MKKEPEITLNYTVVSTSSILSKKYGGKWKHHRKSGHWYSDEIPGYACHVRMCDHDDDCGCPSVLMYYNKGSEIVPSL